MPAAQWMAMTAAFEDSTGGKVREWLDSTTDLDIRNDHDFTALMIASKKGRLDVVMKLLEKSVNVDLQNIAGDTALHIACQEGHSDIVSALIEAGANVNAGNDHGNTPLHYACFRRYQEIAELLLQSNAILAAFNKYEQLPVIFAGRKLSAHLTELASQLGMDNQEIHMQTRSVEAVQAVAKAKHIASTRKQLWEMLPDAVRLGEMIHVSETCQLYQATCSNVSVICKKLISRRQQPSANDLQLFRQAMEPMQTVFHKNLVSVFGIVATTGFSAVLYDMSAVSPLNLEQLLHDADVMFKPIQVLMFAKDVVQGLIHLHSLKMAHLDLKSRNLLVQQSYEGRKVAMVEYGLHNTILGHSQDFDDRLFEPEWIAPEVLIEGKYTQLEAADVYSFGILLYEMVTRVPPYGDMNAMHVGLKVTLEGLRPDIPEYVPVSLKQLMQVCWSDEPKNRPSLAEVDTIIDELMVNEDSN
eukprot:Partr_v1_DN25952_c0_g1_i2_m68288 putative integrin-linked kinase